MHSIQRFVPCGLPEAALSLQHSCKGATSLTLNAFRSLLSLLPGQVEARLTLGPTSRTCTPIHLHSPRALRPFSARAPHHRQPASLCPRPP